MIVVSDASPLAALTYIDQIDLLRQLLGRVLVPDAVWNEVTIQGAQFPGRSALRDVQWIERRSVQNRQLVVALLQNLDLGEAEAIALGVESGADLLLMDERLGRQTATLFGLSVIGVVGVLVEAKKRGLISELKPLLDDLRDRAGFWLGGDLYRRVLSDQNEL
ncbi:MAG: DUF3368 domain-containing protein [Caldilineales bacterium]|nr:DUF3368 domain-containing protein [Caldilineales bacterium]